MKGALVAVLRGEIDLSNSDGSPSQITKVSCMTHYALVGGGNFETLLR